MSTTIPRLSPAKRRLLEHVTATGPTSASNRQLGSELGVDPTTVKRSLRALEQNGLVVIDRRVPDVAAGDETGRTVIPVEVA